MTKKNDKNIYVPPCVETVMLGNMHTLLTGSIREVSGGEFEENIGGSTDPARAKEVYSWSEGWEE